MKNKTLHIVDSYSTNYYHEIFNAGLLILCSHNAEYISYHASNSSRKYVISRIKEEHYEYTLSKIEEKPLRVVKNDTVWGRLCRTYLSAFQNVRYLFKGGRNPIIFMHNDAFSIYWLSIFNLFLKRSIWIVCHGELELLISSPRWYKPSFLYKKLFSFFFRYAPLSSRMHFIVLGESIRENLNLILPQRCKDLFIAIRHPYFFESRDESRKIVSEKLSLGTIGSMSVFKGYDRLVSLAEMLKFVIQKDKLKISIVGKLENINLPDCSLIQYLGKLDGMLSREEYLQMVSELDYVLFLYATDTYKLIASGAIFDAISLGKPIIALRNDYFNSIFKECGDLGYLCDSLDDLYKVILRIKDEPDILTCEMFRVNMEKIKYLYAPDHIKLDLY